MCFETNVDEIIERVTEWIQEVNARYMKEHVKGMRWWLKELNDVRGQVRKGRMAESKKGKKRRCGCKTE